MAVLYFDAHGDINSPESSTSKYFYGMHVRILLGEGDQNILKLLDSKLLPSQLIMLGPRDLEKPEKEFIREQNISLIEVTDIEENIEIVLKEVKDRGFENIYIHIDLDVLALDEFPHVHVPVPGGLKVNTLCKVLKKLYMEFNTIGMGIFEYDPSGKKEMKLLDEIINMGVNL